MSEKTRRDFLKLSALAAVSAAAGSAPISKAIAGPGRHRSPHGRGNEMPGRIVLFHDSTMDGHESTIDVDQVEAGVHACVRLLTGIDDTAMAFESLFPGLHSGSRIAIKVNCLAWNDTRWEVVRGVASGLSSMLDGTYDISQVTIYDVQTTLSDHGYIGERFDFGGNTARITSSNDCSSSYYVYGSHRLSNFILNGDYLINIPVLKAHNAGYPEHLITTAMKNNYGSICPQNLCNNIPGMLAVNADPNVRDKTSLIITSALRGTYNGGPWEPAQLWNTFAEQTPNMLLATTDPVTEAYWARDLINAERDARGMPVFDCPWVEEAAEPPYSLGISDPDAMDVVYVDPATVTDLSPVRNGTYLAPNAPNPFTEATMLRFRLGRPGSARLVVVGASGRVLRRLVDREFPVGNHELQWNGRDDTGRRVAAGVYFVRLDAGGATTTRQVMITK